MSRSRPHRPFRTLARVSYIGWAVAFLLLGAGPGSAQDLLPRVLSLDVVVPGTEEQDIRWPVAVATAEGQIAVADVFGPRLLLFTGDGMTWQLARTVELPGMPIDLIHDGRRFVASLRGEGGLVAFEGLQLLQRRIGLPRDVVPGPLASLPGGGLLVYDFAAERVLELDEDGALGREIDIGEIVTGLAATSSGGFHAAVSESGSILRYDANGQREAVWPVPQQGAVPAWPAGIVVESGGDLLVVDRHGDRVVVLDTAGRAIGVGSRRGAEPGLVHFPGAIALLPDGRCIVADQGNGRVQIFRRSDGEAAQ